MCGGLPLDRYQADFAVVWSYGTVLHPNIMWACLWRSAGVCGGILRHLGCVWGCVGVFRLIAIKRIWSWFGPMALYCILTSCGHVSGGRQVCVGALRAKMKVDP